LDERHIEFGKKETLPVMDIYIAPIQICSRRFTKVKELKRKIYEKTT